MGEETEEKKTEASSTTQPSSSSALTSEWQTGTELLKEPNHHVRMAAGVALEEIEEVLEKCLQKVRRIKTIVGTDKENEEYSKELMAFYISLVSLKNTNLMDGEWLERKIFHIANTCRKTELECLSDVVKEAMRDVYPNIPIFPVIGQGVFGREEKEESSIEGKVREDIEEHKNPEIAEKLLAEKMQYKVKSKIMEYKGEMK